MVPGSETRRTPTPGQQLIEIQSDEISAERIWLHRSPVGYVCMGLGPSAKLARFAFEDMAPEHSFYDACRRHDRDVAREGLAKARRLGLEIPFDALDDPALRRLAIAAALLKAGFDPSEDRDHDGRWTDGAGGAAAARTTQSLTAEASLLGPLSPLTSTSLARLALRFSGVTTFLGIVFIPTNKMLVTRGTVPDHPDIKFTYDDETGNLTIHRDGEDGRSYGFAGRLGKDGLFRDDQGRAFARRLDDGTIVFDPDALPGLKADPGTSGDQPKLCPDPVPDVPRGLHGPDGEIDPKRIDNAARYQRYISEVVNGKKNALEIGLGVALTNPVTGKSVVFDECRQSDGTMIDAKYNYIPMMENKYPQPWQGALEDMLKRARNQVQAAAGRDIEWYFSEKKVADFMANYLADQNIPIKVIHMPMPPELVKVIATTEAPMQLWRVSATHEAADFAQTNGWRA